MRPAAPRVPTDEAHSPLSPLRGAAEQVLEALRLEQTAQVAALNDEVQKLRMLFLSQQPSGAGARR